ncbi:MAG: hypothetical protein LBP92_01945 [Deltaproteobacteria bacterium]|jgi:hypothetical protein|nr:hypothetical protein [Deltaproteobacteria bacterium]
MPSQTAPTDQAQTAPAGSDFQTEHNPDHFQSLDELVSQLTSGMQIFAVAIKNIGLYPANSNIRKESLEKLFKWLGPFVDEHESVRLFIDPDTLVFQGQIVHKDKGGDTGLFFPLFRDGLQWLEFLDGLTMRELENFIILINSFRILKEDDENDIVTAMWEAEFEGIRYKTANEYWDIDPMTEIAALSAGPWQKAGHDQSLAEMSPREGSQGAASLLALFDGLDPNGGGGQGRVSLERIGTPARPAGSGGFTGLTPEDDLAAFRKMELTDAERGTVADLIAQEMAPMPLLDGLEPALDLLWRLGSLAQCAPILTFLAEATKFGLASGFFPQVLDLYMRVASLTGQAGQRLEGVLDEYRKRLGMRETLEGLLLFAIPPGQGPDGLETLGQFLDSFLSVLQPSAAKEMAWLCNHVKEPWLLDRLLRTIAIFSPQCGPELTSYINSALPVPMILALAGYLKLSDRGEAALCGLSHHTHPQVREASALVLLARNPGHISSMSHMLNEPEPTLCRSVYHYLGLKRDAAVEKTLLSFLRSSYETSSVKNTETIMNCYRALGQSATSAAAADFVTGVLNKKSVRSLLGLSMDHELAHRAGAAMALSLMGQAEAVSKAAHSVFTDLRKAVRQADAAIEKARASRVPRGRGPTE